MRIFRDKTRLSNPEQALPGRNQAMPVTNLHYVKGTPIQPPFPADTRTALFGLGCFWGAERCFWELPGVYSTAVGYTAGYTPNPTYQEVRSGLTGHNEVVLVIFRPQDIDFEILLCRFWEAHEPTQGMRQGNDVGTQYRSGIISPMTRKRPRKQAPSVLPSSAYKGRLRGDYNRDPAGTGILLRGGLSPAVSGQESGQLLRSRRLPSGLSEPGRRQSGLICP